MLHALALDYKSNSRNFLCSAAFLSGEVGTFYKLLAMAACYYLTVLVLTAAAVHAQDAVLIGLQARQCNAIGNRNLGGFYLRA